MNSPRITRHFAGLAATIISLACVLAAHAQDLELYTALQAPANRQIGVTHFLQLTTLTPGTGPFTITSLILGVNFTAGTTDQGMKILFYTGVDTSPTAVNALATATYIGGANGVLTAPGTPNTDRTYTFFVSTANIVSPTSNVIGAEILLTDSTFTNYSNDLNARFTASAPTAGNAPGYVWNDADFNGNFTGAEQTKFNQTNAYARFALVGTVPEPGTWALLATGLGMVGVAARRRLAR